MAGRRLHVLGGCSRVSGGARVLPPPLLLSPPPRCLRPLPPQAPSAAGLLTAAAAAAALRPPASSQLQRGAWLASDDGPRRIQPLRHVGVVPRGCSSIAVQCGRVDAAQQRQHVAGRLERRSRAAPSRRPKRLHKAHDYARDSAEGASPAQESRRRPLQAAAAPMGGCSPPHELTAEIDVGGGSQEDAGAACVAKRYHPAVRPPRHPVLHAQGRQHAQAALCTAALCMGSGNGTKKRGKCFNEREKELLGRPALAGCKAGGLHVRRAAAVWGARNWRRRGGGG
jgi:hypothetical protein